MSRKAQLRETLFQQGAVALEAARPNAPKGYVCPICLIGSQDLEMFSLEHVPPKSVGGAPLLLTCTDCNSTAGHELDVHLLERSIEDEVAVGKRSKDIRITLEGETITASAKLDDGWLAIVGDANRSDPKSYDSFFGELDRLSKSGATEYGFNLTYQTRLDPWRESVAWLRIGYLYAFAVLGFNYILRPQLEPIRSQIRNPKDRFLSQLVKRVGQPLADDGLFFVFTPREYRSILFNFKGHLVVLPDFEHPSTFEERVLGSAPEEWPREMTGKLLPLPSRPYFFLDHRPSLVRLISPDHTESRCP